MISIFIAVARSVMETQSTALFGKPPAAAPRRDAPDHTTAIFQSG
jgi:hypothetical protein